MHLFTVNDAEKRIGEAKIDGLLLRAGRFFLYIKGDCLLKTEWSFGHTLNWIEASIQFGGERQMMTASLILPWIVSCSLGVKLPSWALSWWMIEDRVFAAKFFYVSSIAWLSIAHAQWAEDCGMTSYYRREVPRRYNSLQLWPGWELRLRWPPLAKWVLGKESVKTEIVDSSNVTIEMDGRSYSGSWRLERRSRTRPRWPWEYGASFSSWVDMGDPPRFAGKGENSWDCGDDGMYGMGSSETTKAGAVGEYIKRVLQYRERYGMPSEKALETA